MAMSARSTDPIEEMLAQEAQADHGQAKARGERVRTLADAVISSLNARGFLRGSAEDARVEIFHPIADALYSDAAIDIPNLRGRS